ncbi:Ger(x)C family spore germination protein [Aquibacillus koreensis]|uniref:Ger(X)C family spore germination protein n=1 Tax=Aquibacillus koreensis TaxID=279446 RepID=A0A9X3WMD5_9BACI|nr:Ger(x)C family spore germination protein [Aquibacillus koreensis]MCT2537103.1 Ger(x)C family spore germination protein [Aquibacillus koreensis]MDC3419914.1 Ger(x)C family spore germination protein [Aquibacillus koreensis]
MNIKKSKIYILLVMLLLLTSGCWDNRDINHRVMPVVLGVSKESEEEYKAYLQVPILQEDGIKTQIITGVGKTINEIVDKTSANLESNVDLLHIKVIVIDRAFAEEGVKDLISGIMRSREIPSKALVAICEEDMDEFFKKMSQVELSDGTALLDYFEKNAGWNPQIALTRVWHVYRSIHSYTKDVAIPIIRLGESTLIEQAGSAVIKNGAMLDEINSDETLLYNAFQGMSAHGKIEVLDEGSVLILDNGLNFASRLENELPILTLELQLEVMILEVKGDPTIEKIEKELEKLLKPRFENMITKLKDSEADILGIGQLFRKEIPRAQLKDWRSKYYPNLKFNLTVDVTIQNSGNLKEPGE